MYKMADVPPKTMPFKLLYITHSEYDKGWHSTLHTHHFTELFYIVKGKGAFVLPTHEVPVKENDLVIINPHTMHTEKSNEKDSLEYIALGIEGIAFTLPDEKESIIGLYTYQGEREEILFYLHTLLREVQSGADDYDIVCQNIIEILIVKLQRAKQFTIERHEPKNLTPPVALVKHYIEHKYRTPINLDLLAEVGNINKYYLAHRFKKEIGLSPIEYLIQVRIKQAQTHLETTDYTIGEIARFNGFSSQSFFSQAFKRETNETPSQYRKRCRKQATVINVETIPKS